ncbi:hypothetical protein NHX12_001823 [Muraenolepis orangiensis]|uniref:Uncharacterized protein n=1 Tax=Muraenolepis orangiensis TaxID=630683 RepID=A0A9Q0E0G2_9TELE|nr:hypothetical protein NHX12_001823 [Muraenolepis orangiensis]
MVTKPRKQTAGKTQVERDKSPPVVKSSLRRAGREGKALGGFLPMSSGRTRLGLTPGAFTKLGTTLLLDQSVIDRGVDTMKCLRLFFFCSCTCWISPLGLYYSYYKTIIDAPSFLGGLHLVMNDRLTEYPLVINTLKRFNLYPEVVLASWYRTYTGVMDFFGVPTKMCWSINRGEGLAPVDSCEGLGDPAYFYVTFVFLLNGFMMSLFFIYGAYLRYLPLTFHPPTHLFSRLGGLVTTVCFFFNHGESTRVMWTPPLRESFAYPFLVMQMLILTYILRTRSPSRTSMVALGVSTLCFMLPWQFAQFVLLTQVASLFASYILGYLSPTKLQSILVTHMVGDLKPPSKLTPFVQGKRECQKKSGNDPKLHSLISEAHCRQVFKTNKPHSFCSLRFHGFH